MPSDTVTVKLFETVSPASSASTAAAFLVKAYAPVEVFTVSVP